MPEFSNWGRYPVCDGELFAFHLAEQLAHLLPHLSETIARGAGRSYGDSSLNSKMVSTLAFKRILAFDENKGVLSCQAGATLAEILDVIVPKKWFLPVSPGTKFVTVGGALAADVHGKNHHKAGSFSNFVLSFRLMDWAGKIWRCSPTENAELFWATCGGMGLTGIILDVEFRLTAIESSRIVRLTQPCRNLDEAMDAFEENAGATYSVAWIDCLAKGDKLGRSVLFLGEHERRLDGERETHNRKKSLSVPFSAPSFFMQSSFVRFFNAMYFASHKKAKTDVVGYETFFYPLDRILHWNRIYGRWGFSQYQLVLPKENSKKGLQKILSKIADSGQGSFLAVLKLFGKQDSFLSFPMEGFTLALDFPVKPLTLSLMNELDELVLEYGGRLYLGKDARMSAGMFAKSYSHAQRFREVKRRVDPDAKFASLQSRRLEI